MLLLIYDNMVDVSSRNKSQNYYLFVYKLTH